MRSPANAPASPTPRFVLPSILASRQTIRPRRTTRARTTNGEAIAERIGWTVVKVYRDQGVSGAKSRQNRPAFDALTARTPNSRRQFDLISGLVEVDRLGRSLQDLVGFLTEIHMLSASTYSCISKARGHHHSGWQGPIPDDGRVRRV